MRPRQSAGAGVRCRIAPMVQFGHTDSDFGLFPSNVSMITSIWALGHNLVFDETGVRDSRWRKYLQTFTKRQAWIPAAQKIDNASLQELLEILHAIPYVGQANLRKEKADRGLNIPLTDAVCKDFLRFANPVKGEMFIASASISLKTA